MLQSEGMELPLEIVVLIQEVEHARPSFPLDPSATNWTDSQLAGLAAEEEVPGFDVLIDPGVLSALPESSEPHQIRLDQMERLEPELSFLLATLEPQHLLRSVAVDRELGSIGRC